MPESMDSLFNPWVMRCAWNKVKTWYSTGEWYDPAEFLAWEADPWRHLGELAHELARGDYRPGPFPGVPYPKKDDYTRHYTIPSVRDQVAFMAYLVLLGPFLEARMPNVSFGSRLFRPRVPLGGGRGQNGRKKRWYRAPFSLNAGRVYDGFAASYGLFRRLLQWIANKAVLGDEVNPLAEEELECEDPDSLPYEEFLKGKYKGRDLAYARVDLSLAFPSVDRDYLREAIVTLLRNDYGSSRNGKPDPDERWGRPTFPKLTVPDSQGFKTWLEPPRLVPDGHPWHTLSEDEEARLELGERLGALVSNITYAPWPEPSEWESYQKCDFPDPSLSEKGDRDKVVHDDRLAKRLDSHGLWPAGCHLDRDYIISNSFGLPTGLAISGLLLNVALTRVDESMCRMIEEVAGGRDGGLLFYLRFVDDMVLLASDHRILESAIVNLQEQLKKASERFILNGKKAKPDSVAEFLGELQKRGRGERPSPKAAVSLNLAPGDYLTRANLEMFTTSIVREMSELAEEALDESFGASGLDRINQLLELASRDIEDDEVANDTRLSFAINKIARASWPEKAIVEDNKVIQPKTYVRRILVVAEMALRRHPWRFKLWKAVLIIALRASLVGGEELAKSWLEKHVLPLISWDRGKTQRISDRSWEAVELNKPESDPDGHVPGDVLERRGHHRRLRVSFHRAHFWRQWAVCVRALEWVMKEEEGDGTSRPGAWTSYFTPESAKRVLKWFGNFGQFAKVLYGKTKPGYWPDRPFFWWWEAEAIGDAMLAVSPPSYELLESLGSPKAGRLREPLNWSPKELSELRGKWVQQFREALDNVLGDRRVGNGEAGKPRSLPPVLWCVRCCRTEEQDLFDAAGRGAIYPEPGKDALEWAAIARVDYWDRSGNLADLIHTALPLPQNMGTDLWSKVIRLDSYHVLRRLLMAHGKEVDWGLFASWFPEVPNGGCGGDDASSPRTLLDAFYTLDKGRDTRPHESEAPALELDPGLAYDIVGALPRTGADSELISPDTIELFPEAEDEIKKLRQALLVSESAYAPIPPLSLNSKDIIEKVQRLSVGRAAPHPLYLFPALSLVCEYECAELGEMEGPINSWNRAILFLWMVSGSENLLDHIYRWAPWQMPLSDRDSIRCRYLLPGDVWESLEKALGSFGALIPGRQMVSSAEKVLSKEGRQRFIRDIVFNSDGDWDLSADNSMPPSTSYRYFDELHVRLVQALETPDMRKWLPAKGRSYFSSGREALKRLSLELAERLGEAKGQARFCDKEFREHLVIFPEWYVPARYVGKMKQFVRETGIAVLAGLLPGELPRAIPVIRPLKGSGLRCLVNEAILILPDTSYDDGCIPPSRVYEFRIRKRYPSVSELGLIRHLSKSGRWAFACGLYWYRFSYSGWGSFSVSICSDILDSGVWDWLRGRIRHLFITAFNEDIDLFDQMTWTRGYELYANVASVNHGKHGGSVVWSPKHGHGKEVFKTHGARKGLAITVELPVKGLVEAQKGQIAKSVAEECRIWDGIAKGLQKNVSGGDFKSPPSGYPEVRE